MYTKDAPGRVRFDCGCDYDVYRQQYILCHSCIPCEKHRQAHFRRHGDYANFKNIDLSVKRS